MGVGIAKGLGRFWAAEKCNVCHIRYDLHSGYERDKIETKPAHKHPTPNKKRRSLPWEIFRMDSQDPAALNMYCNVL
jgi:hypothetical protein